MVAKMMTRSPGKVAIFAGVLAGVFYLWMIFGPLAQLHDISGLKPLDLRPFGYSGDEVRSLFSKLGSEGRDIYLFQQLPLDAVYPGALAVTLIAALHWLKGEGGLTLVGKTGVFAAVCAALADYLENSAILFLLLLWPSESSDVVKWASLATLTKSATTTFAVTTVLALFVARFSSWIARRQKMGL